MSGYPLSTRQFFGAKRIAKWLGIKSHVWITHLLILGINTLYHRWYKKKKDGGFRPIDSPDKRLKNLQRRIYKRIYELIGHTISPISQGFMPGDSIKWNAFCHVDGRSMFALDIKSAFPSARFVVTAQELELERKSDLEVLKSLVERDGRLVQGAPTSPLAFNLTCRELDRELEELAERTGGTITRYADNIIFSWPFDKIPARLKGAIRRIITKHGFTINHQKVAYIENGNRDSVPLRLPGVHIVNGHLRIPHRQLRRMRSRLYHALQDNDWPMVCSIIAYARWLEGSVPRQLGQMLEKFHREIN